MDQRVKGQECTILITTNGVLEDTLVDIQNFNLEAEFEIKTVGYLGEKSNRTDYIFNGVKGDLELHIHKQAWFVFLNTMKDKAQRVTPDTVFNMTAVLAMPNGETPDVLIPDVSWGATPMRVSSRGDYVTMKLQYAAGDFTATTE